MNLSRNVRFWVIGIVLAALVVGGAYAVTSSLGQMQMSQEPQAKPEVWERIAAALERIAGAMEKSAGGLGMMGQMPGMMGHMGYRGMMRHTMQGMMQQMQGMMQQMQGMMGMMQPDWQSKINCAVSWLEKAIALHELHMKDPTTTTEPSQMELMDQIKKAHECLTSTQMPGTSP